VTIVESPEALARATTGPLALSIGNFDGFHRGHRVVVAELLSRARGLGATPVVTTFEPHPLGVVHPGRVPRLLTTTEEKVELLAAAGVEIVFLVPFDGRIASMPATRFLGWLGVRRGWHFVLGDDFRMGHDRRCDIEVLDGLGRTMGFALDAVPAVVYESARISSSRIRESLSAGRLTEANAMLGAPYRLGGTVVSGEGRGRRLGVATANLSVAAEKLLPADGVYAALAELAEPRPAALYVGDRPTYPGSGRSVEVHLLDADLDLKGGTLGVRVLERIRADRAFPTESDLGKEIRKDLEAIRRRVEEGRTRSGGGALFRFDKVGGLC